MAVFMFALAIPAMAAFLLPAAAPAPAGARAKAHRVAVAGSAGSVAVAAPTALNLAASLRTHEALLAEAARTKVNVVLRAADNIADNTPPAAEDNRPEVPDARKIALFYTGNVIGEHDPCG